MSRSGKRQLLTYVKVRWELEAGAGSRGDRQRWGAGCAFLAGGGSRNPGPPEGQRKVRHGHLAAPLGPHLACLGPESQAPAEEPCAKLQAVGTPALQPHEPPAQLRPRLLPTTQAWALLPRPPAGRPPGQTPSALRPADCRRGPPPQNTAPEAGGPNVLFAVHPRAPRAVRSLPGLRLHVPEPIHCLPPPTPASAQHARPCPPARAPPGPPPSSLLSPAPCTPLIIPSSTH